MKKQSYQTFSATKKGRRQCTAAVYTFDGWRVYPSYAEILEAFGYEFFILREDGLFRAYDYRSSMPVAPACKRYDECLTVSVANMKKHLNKYEEAIKNVIRRLAPLNLLDYGLLY